MDWSFVLLAAGIIFGFVGISIARNKGVDPSAGFLLGAFLGPIGLVIVALLKPNANSTLQGEAYKGARDLGLNSYRLWLSNKYSISRNEVLNLYTIQGEAFPDLESALQQADKLERKSVAKADENLRRMRKAAPYVLGASCLILLALWSMEESSRDARIKAFDAQLLTDDYLSTEPDRVARAARAAEIAAAAAAGATVEKSSVERDVVAEADAAALAAAGAGTLPVRAVEKSSVERDVVAEADAAALAAAGMSAD